MLVKGATGGNDKLRCRSDGRVGIITPRSWQCIKLNWSVTNKRTLYLAMEINWNPPRQRKNRNTFTMEYSYIFMVYSLLTHWGARQNSRHSAYYIFKCVFLNENVLIFHRFFPKGQINKIPELVQIMAWRRPGDKPLSEPMMINFPQHICVTRHQLVKQTGTIISTWINFNPSMDT